MKQTATNIDIIPQKILVNLPPTEELSAYDRNEKERKEILRRYRLILRHARERLKDDDAKKIKKAFEIAYEAHKDVRRKSGEPYIYHPLEVARIVVDEMGLGATSIVCALLHDVVEDTEIKLTDIEGQFGTKISKIIDGLTKIKDASDKSLSMQAENFKKMLLTISEDIRVVFIKIADRLHNMRTLESMPRDKQLKIKSETEYVYAPLAHRLGLYSIKSELEDLCLKFSDGHAYEDIEEKIRKTQPARDRFIKDFIKPIEEALKKQNFNFTIKSRLKSIFSIWNKMHKQGVAFDEVFDLFAIRVIVDVPIEDEKAACWRIYSTITDFYQPNPNRLRDWISFPKSTGYESLHVTVMSGIGQWVEVQIRTKRMDEIAEMGLAAHWKYKEKNGITTHDSGIEEWLKKVRESLEQKDVTALEFLDEFRRNLFSEEVFVFTPKGDLKTLQMGATILDFAFEIHTEVGAKCLGAKVNQRLVPLNYRLKSGDQVEILTSTKIKANEDWLKLVVTTKARNKIKEYIKDGKKDTIRDGKEIVLRKLKQMKLTLTHEILAQILDYFNVKSEPEFFYAVGKGTIDHTQIKKFQEKAEAEKLAKLSEVPMPEVPKIEKKSHKKEIKEIVVGGQTDRIEYALSQCCNPIPGDEIFGIVTVSKGIKIHRTGCPNAVDIMASFGDRIIKARWADDKSQVFDATLKIIGTDRVGLVSDVTRVISNQLKVNITSLAFEVHTGVFEGTISLSVYDTRQADEMTEQLGKIEGVVNVTRYNY
ncbi:MAG: bifunctional (p)ppGpp synthetase/guanosine-3',5'-bis(diphosphate) 3'-pyrophosphohydrolase [Cytophagales bacterium]|nr:MAG: bifunctional (p)ppGpp synthetase/guanosine-3',5'-bis(diphosphate) 3'-pyrophosphohydrolase [Cytophagales bacterium]